MDISKVDANFKIESDIEKDNIKFYNPNQSPFAVYGVFFDNGRYLRLPKNVAEAVNEGVCALYDNTAGGRILFKTDSDYIALHTKMHSIGKMPHFAFSGSVGFDLYERKGKNQEFIGAFIPPVNIENGFESVINLKGGGMREYVINFPTYSAVDSVYIGLNENAQIESADRYDGDKPIVFYGSSITQGGCSSRPGNSYEALISSRLNRDYINLGFSGSAKGEDAIADYISHLEMSFFVYDYDHNAPTPEHLRKTHEKMFKTIRKANPELPILILSRPKHRLSDEEIERLNIIRNTYENAAKNGDKNVYFLPGNEIFDDAADNIGTVDYTHPNDYGFYIMAKKIGAVIEKVINKKVTERVK